jgi:hypothetical protein
MREIASKSKQEMILDTKGNRTDELTTGHDQYVVLLVEL